MVCRTCGEESAYIKITSGGVELCSNCGGFSESSGVDTDNIITRSSQRVRQQHITSEGDQILPHIYDRNQKKAVVNQDFIDKYPNRVKDSYSKQELKKMKWVQPKMKQDVKAGKVEFEGTPDVKGVLDGTKKD